MKGYKDLLHLKQNQSELRDMLWAYFYKNPIARTKLSALIGVSTITLQRFMDKGLDLGTANVLKVKNFLEAQG